MRAGLGHFLLCNSHILTFSQTHPTSLLQVSRHCRSKPRNPQGLGCKETQRVPQGGRRPRRPPAGVGRGGETAVLSENKNVNSRENFYF